MCNSRRAHQLIDALRGRQRELGDSERVLLATLDDAAHTRGHGQGQGAGASASDVAALVHEVVHEAVEEVDLYAQTTTIGKAGTI